jgi:hypothetical protein
MVPLAGEASAIQGSVKQARDVQQRRNEGSQGFGNPATNSK